MRNYLLFLTALFILGCGSGGGGGGGDTEPVILTPEFPDAATKRPLLVIQIEFNDYQFHSSNYAWSQKLFGDGEGQLNDYFLEISQDAFVFSPARETYSGVNDGIITVRLNKNHPGDSTASFTFDIADAAVLADPYIDFSSYDTNNDNKIQDSELQLMFLVAGGETAYGDDDRSSIWAHAWCLNGLPTNAPAPFLDGTFIMQCSDGGYSRFGERHGTHDATIGIIAHELGHAAFSLPDLYDVDESSGGIGDFGLMGAGMWGQKSLDVFPGSSPVHMMAWSKMQSSFSTTQSITVNTNNVVLNDSFSPAYSPIRINTQNPGEYFLLENRSASGYDAGLFILDGLAFQGGVALWHIDENQADNDDETHRLVDLEEADGFLLDGTLDRGDQTNLFYAGNPAGSYTGEFTPISTPADSKIYSGADSNITIENITVPGVQMYLDIQL